MTNRCNIMARHSWPIKLVFIPHLIKIVMEVMDSGPPYGFKTVDGVDMGIIPVKQLSYNKSTFASVEFLEDHRTVTLLK